MKNILLLPLLLVTTIACSQQKADLLKTLDKDIAQLEAMQRLNGLRIEPGGSSGNFNASDEHNFEAAGNENMADHNRLQKFFDERESSVAITPPYNLIEIKTREAELLKLLRKDSFYFMHNPNMVPRYKPVAVHYLDGTTENNPKFSDEYVVAEKYAGKGEHENEVLITKATPVEQYLWKEKSSFSEETAIYSNKPVKGIDYVVELPVQQTKTYKITRAGEVLNTVAGPVEVKGIGGDAVILVFKHGLKDQLAAHGYYKDGRELRRKGYSSHTVVTPAKQAAYEKLKQLFKDARAQVASGMIKDKVALRAWLEKRIPAGLDDEKGQEEVKYVFAGPVTAAAIDVTDTLSAVQKFNVSYDFWDKEDINPYISATDFATRKKGILDLKGNWVVKPVYDEYFRMANKYFFRDQIEDKDEYYRFDYTTKALVKVPYKLNDYKLYNGKYVVIEPRVNGLKGVADATTGTVVLPMKHGFLRQEAGGAWVGDIDDKSGAYDKDLKPVLPFVYDRVEFTDGYFYTRKGVVEDVYNMAGKNLTRGRFKSTEGVYHNGRLVVYNYRTNGRAFTVLDEGGNVVFNAAERGYKEVKPYSAGMAAVKGAEGLWGFVDIDGKLVIPYKFQDVNWGFFKASRLAPVRVRDAGAYINTKGEVVKKFAGTFTVESHSDESEERGVMVNDVFYDEYGRAREKK